MSSRSRGFRAWVAFGVLASTSAIGCATYSEKTTEARASLRRGQLQQGLEAFNRFLKVDDAERFPEKWNGAKALAVLERATVLQALTRYGVSAENFQVADKQLEMLDIARDAVGKIGKYIYSDQATKYKTSPTEKLCLNGLNMINYMVQGDLDGAAIEARRFTVIRDYLRDYQPEHVHGAFASYLAGFVFEWRGQPRRALRYYDEALAEEDFASLRGPIQRLARQSDYRGERIRSYLPTEVASSAPATEQQAEPADDASSADPRAAAPVSTAAQDAETASPPRASRPAELLVVVKTGRVPYKEPRRIPVGAAVGIASAYITGDPTLLEYGLFKVVVYPELVPAQNLFTQADLYVDGKPIRMEIASELGTEIVREWEDIKPKVIGAALTRMIARAAAAEGARAAGKQAKEGGQIIGFLAAAAVEGTLVALDRPDTRSWTTLPARVHIGRVALPPGQHRVDVVVSGPGGETRRVTDVNIPEHGYVVLDATTLR